MADARIEHLSKDIQNDGLLIKVVEKLCSDMQNLQIQSEKIIDFVNKMKTSSKLSKFGSEMDQLVENYKRNEQSEQFEQNIKYSVRQRNLTTSNKGWVTLEKGQENEQNPFQTASTEGGNSGNGAISADKKADPSTPDKADGKQWLGGIESILGGGYMNLGNQKARSTTLKSLGSRVSTIGNKTQQSLMSFYKNTTLTQSPSGTIDVQKPNKSDEKTSFEFDPNQSPEIDPNLVSSTIVPETKPKPLSEPPMKPLQEQTAAKKDDDERKSMGSPMSDQTDEQPPQKTNSIKTNTSNIPNRPM